MTPMSRAPSRSPRQPRPSARPGPRGKTARPAPPAKPARRAPVRPVKPAARTAKRATPPRPASGARCTEVLKRLQKFIENEFSDRERAVIDAHLAGCPDCRAEYESMRSLIDTLDKTRIVTVPDSFRDAVLARIKSGR